MSEESHGGRGAIARRLVLRFSTPRMWHCSRAVSLSSDRWCENPFSHHLWRNPFRAASNRTEKGFSVQRVARRSVPLPVPVWPSLALRARIKRPGLPLAGASGSDQRSGAGSRQQSRAWGCPILLRRPQVDVRVGDGARGGKHRHLSPHPDRLPTTQATDAGSDTHRRAAASWHPSNHCSQAVSV